MKETVLVLQQKRKGNKKAHKGQNLNFLGTLTVKVKPLFTGQKGEGPEKENARPGKSRNTVEV